MFEFRRLLYRVLRTPLRPRNLQPLQQYSCIFAFRQFKPSSFLYREVRACLVYLQDKGWHQLEKDGTVKSTTPANQGGEIREKDPLNKIQIIRGRVAESRVTGTVREVEEHMVGADRFQLLPRQNEEERKASEERLVKKKKPILLGIWP